MRVRRLLATALIFQLLFAPSTPVFASDQNGTTARSARGGHVTTAQSGPSVKVGAHAASGRAALSVPIQVAPGTNGVQPEISLEYSSASRANGWVGKGWRLDLGSIELSRKRGVPSYLGADTLLLDGEELMPSGQ